MYPVGRFNNSLPTSLSKINLDFISYFGDPVGFWVPCNGPENKLYDFSRYKNTGTFNGNLTTAQVNFASIYKSWNGNGTNSYINIPSATKIPQGSHARTLMSFVYLRSIASGNNSSFITQVPVVGGNQGFTFQAALIGGNYYLFTDGVNIGNNITINTNIPPLNSWHHYALVFDGSFGWKYYFDGKLTLSGSFSVAINTISNDIKLMGRTEAVNTGYLDGMQAYSVMWPYAFTDSKIKSAYNSFLYGEPFQIFQPSVFEHYYPLSTVTTLHLTSKSFIFSSSFAQESVSRKVLAESISQTYLRANMSLIKNLSSQSLDQTESNSNNKIQRGLSSQSIEQTELTGLVSINQKLASQFISQSIGKGDYTTQISTKFELLSMRRYSSQYFVQGGTVEDTGQ